MAAVSFFILGFYTLLLQIILLRSSFSLFAGNELSVAIQLGLWLAFTALGGFLGNYPRKRIAPYLFALLPMTGIWATLSLRLLPLALQSQPGLEIPFARAILILILAQAPLNLTAGMLFPMLWRQSASDSIPAIGRFYLYETLGATIAGLTFTFVAAGRIPGVTLAFIVSSVMAIASAFILRGAPRAIVIALATILIIAMAAGPQERLDDFTWNIEHPGAQHLAALETPYQRVDLALEQGQHTLYGNGVPIATFEDTESLTSGQHGADLFIALHPNPKKVLIIGNGDPALLARALQYPLEHIVYVLPDAAVQRAVENLSPAWRDARLSVVNADGRRFLNEAADHFSLVPEFPFGNALVPQAPLEEPAVSFPNGNLGTSRSGKFDVIIFDLPPPTSAASNRYFTVEAFTAARRLLANEGVLAFSLPSSAHYLAGDAELFLASVYRALQSAFTKSTILAGDAMVFVGGNDTVSFEQLARNFSQNAANVPMETSSDISRSALFTALFEPLFDPFRNEQQKASIAAANVFTNTDARPIAYFLNLRHWVRKGGLHWLEKAMTWITTLRLKPVLYAAGATVAIILAAVFLTRRTISIRPVLVTVIASSGAAGMLGQLAVVYLYQNLFGDLYQDMGLLFASYMAGLAAGSAFTEIWGRYPYFRSRTQRRVGAAERNPPLRLFRRFCRWLVAPGRWFWWVPLRCTHPTGLVALRAAMAVICLAAGFTASVHSKAAFLAALFAYAFLFGTEYPIANRLFAAPKAIGLLHAMDHAGAALAALIGATVLLPILGPQTCLITLAALHGFVLIIQLSVLGRPSGRV